MKYNKPPLRKVLTELKAEADAQPGVLQTVPLRGGLLVAMRVHENEPKISVAIGRKGKVWPSDMEWAVVFRELGWNWQPYQQFVRAGELWLFAIVEKGQMELFSQHDAI
jgi:hypothetical protein